MELYQLTTKVGDRVAGLYIKHFRSKGVTLLFSHGNAVDLGLLRDHALALSCELQVRHPQQLQRERAGPGSLQNSNG